MSTNWFHYGIFCTPDDHHIGRYTIGLQFPYLTINCTSINLGFAQAILDFVAETRNNPMYRDTPLGNGVYRYMNEKSIDLSQYFQDVQFRFEKIGEFDSGYLLRFACADALWLWVEMNSPEMVDLFVDGINEIVNDYVDKLGS